MTEAQIETLKEIEEALGENLQWLYDQLDLSIRQKDQDTIDRLARLNEAWKKSVLLLNP